MSSRRQRAAARREKQQNKAGSRVFREPAFLSIGYLRRPHGVGGEMVMSVNTDFPERIQPGETFFAGEDHKPLVIKSVRHHNQGLIVAFEGVTVREEAALLGNRDLFVKAEDLPPLEEGEFYQHQLLGLKVVTDEGQELGIIAEFIETGANNVLVVRPEEGKDVLLPDIPEVVLEIDLGEKVMRVHLLEGLLPE